jgi:hypothetical protein
MADTSGLSMEDTNTGKALGAVTQSSSAIDQAWSGGQAAISGAQGQLGRGPMGQAFLGIYQPAVQAAGQQVQSLSAGALQLVGAGKTSVADYLHTDDRARATFGALHGGI